MASRATLTGRSLREVLGDPGHSPVAERGGGERLVIPIGERLEGALASLDETRVPEIAASWAKAEEFWGRVGPTNLVAPLTELVALAQRRPRGASARLLLDVCVVIRDLASSAPKE